MLQSWLRLTFLHWRYDPALVQPLLPAGLLVDTYDGAAWVGLVPFEIRGALPWLSNFLETNVRTYAVGPDGSRGVWFFSLDAARLMAVLGARAGFRLPYMWADMRIAVSDGQVLYRSRRKWPRPESEMTNMAVQPGAAYAPAELTPRDHFLTARYRLFTQFGRKLAYAPVEHAAWPLRRADVVALDQSLIEAAGLPSPSGNPLAHFVERIDVRIGAPRFL